MTNLLKSHPPVWPNLVCPQWNLKQISPGLTKQINQWNPTDCKNNIEFLQHHYYVVATTTTWGMTWYFLLKWITNNDIIIINMKFRVIFQIRMNIYAQLCVLWTVLVNHVKVNDLILLFTSFKYFPYFYCLSQSFTSFFIYNKCYSAYI